MSSGSSKESPTLDYLSPKDIKKVIYLPKPEEIEAKKAGYLQPNDDSYVRLDNNFYDQVEDNKSKTRRKMAAFAKYNPFVPIGVLATCGILATGLYAMKKHDRVKSQKMMRWRVAAQGMTVIALVIGTMATQHLSKPSED